MKKICLTSHNPGKIERYQTLLKEQECVLLSLDDLGITEKVAEPFDTSQENALHKAKEYARIISMPVLAVDEEMRTNFLPESLQPGVLVRRLGQSLDRDPSDAEVISYWQELLQTHPHTNQEFYWDFSIVFYNPLTDFVGTITVTQVSEVADYVSVNYNPGYPMSTFMSPKGTGRKPYWDTDPVLRRRVERENFRGLIEVFPQWLREESPV